MCLLLQLRAWCCLALASSHIWILMSCYPAPNHKEGWWGNRGHRRCRSPRGRCVRSAPSDFDKEERAKKKVVRGRPTLSRWSPNPVRGHPTLSRWSPNRNWSPNYDCCKLPNRFRSPNPDSYRLPNRLVSQPLQVAQPNVSFQPKSSNKLVNYP